MTTVRFFPAQPTKHCRLLHNTHKVVCAIHWWRGYHQWRQGICFPQPPQSRSRERPIVYWQRVLVLFFPLFFHLSLSFFLSRFYEIRSRQAGCRVTVYRLVNPIDETVPFFCFVLFFDRRAIRIIWPSVFIRRCRCKSEQFLLLVVFGRCDCVKIFRLL